MDSITPKEEVKKTPTATMSSSDLTEKESVKNVGKGQKGLKERQEMIQMQIENKNIENHVKELTQKFDPPLCVNCPKRRADRVCINKGCGPAKYMQIICGKCHADVHAKSTKKPEIDIEEYLIKLATFMNEQKYLAASKQSQMIDTEHLKLVFEDLNTIREHLGSLKSRLSSEIEGYQSPQQMHSLLQGSITKALSLCEYENIQEQLRSIKKSVLFEKNKFFWNDAGQKFRSFTKIFHSLEDSTANTKRTISKSFIGGVAIDLSEVEAKVSTGLSHGYQGGPIKAKDGLLTIGGTGPHQTSQFYLDYKLESDKKYKMLFKFTENPMSYIMVGIMPQSMVHQQWVYNVPNEYFCKRFYNTAPQNECGRIVRGSDMSYLPTNGYQVEMRFDLQESYMDFSDYPDHKNINANHQHFKLRSNEQYVIAFAFYQNQRIIIEQLEEISSIDAY